MLRCTVEDRLSFVRYHRMSDQLVFDYKHRGYQATHIADLIDGFPGADWSFFISSSKIILKNPRLRVGSRRGQLPWIDALKFFFA